MERGGEVIGGRGIGSRKWETEGVEGVIVVREEGMWLRGCDRVRGTG